MAKNRKTEKKPIEQYDHRGKKRVNNPPVGLVTPETDQETGKKTYAYDPHLAPQRQWADKGEHTSFEVLIVSLHVHERIDQIFFHQPLTTRHYTQFEVLGFDYYNTKTGTIESGGTEKIAVWMLDSDYDGRSLLPRQVFFSMAGEKEVWARLARNLKAEIDEELIEAYCGTVSLPFAAGGHKRVAVKIVDDRGIESLKILEVE
jgi:hypothetical protein